MSYWPALLALMVLAPRAGFGQFLTAMGGASSLMDAYGSKFDFRYPPFSGWLGVGLNRGLHLGAMAATTWHGIDFAAGDRFYPFLLDTDVFDRSYYFDGRGLFLSRHTGASSWTAFAGATAVEFNASFVRTFQTQQAAAAFFYQRRFSPRVVFHSSSVLSRGVTSIQSLAIALSGNWKLDAAAGIGTGHGMFSAATEYKNRWLALTASWTAADDRFQRLHASTAIFSERRGANLQARFTPSSHLGFSLAHENIVAPLPLAGTPPHVALDAATLSLSGAGFGLTGAESISRSGSLSARTQLFTMSRRLSSRVTAYGTAVRSQSAHQQPLDLYLGTVQARLSPRLILDGTVSHTPSGTSWSAGGQFLSNLLTIAIRNQTMVSMLAGGFHGSAVVQAWTVSFLIHMPGGVALHYDSALDGYGKLRYTAFATGMSLAGPERSAPASAPPVNLGRFVVRGMVKDQDGEPVWGIPVRIHDQLLYSDTSGAFSLRLKKRADYRVAVLPEQALNRASWEVVSSPEWAHAGQDDLLLIVMRHRRPQP